MLEESERAALAQTRDAHREVDELLHGGEGVSVVAGRSDVRREDIREKLGVADLLLTHPLDKGLLVGTDARVLEVVCRELCETGVKQIKFDELLVECESLKKR